MIALQIALSSLTPTAPEQQYPVSVALRFGGISASLAIIDGRGGKCLYLDIDERELSDWYEQYACGLFIHSVAGNSFCLLSLNRLSYEDPVICQEVVFVNDCRQAQFRGQFSLTCKPYQQPKIANLTHLAGEQKALDLLKKPAVPKQIPKGQKNMKSFLYGKQPCPDDNLKTLKQDLRKRNETKKSIKKSMEPVVKIKQKQTRVAQIENQQDLFDMNPPVMEFTNNQPVRSPQWSVPQVQQMRSSKSQIPAQPRFNFETPTEPVTFNRKDAGMPPISPQTLQSFDIHKGKSKQMPKKKQLSRQQITQMAIKQVEENHQSRDQVKIPILKGSSFEMVPLSSLTPEQIVEYVQRQRKVEEDIEAGKKKKQELIKQEKELQQQRKKLAQQMQRMLRNQNQLSKKRPSMQIRHSARQSIREEIVSQAEEYDDDFESLSGTNSAIRSRLSSRVQPRKQDDSIDDYSVQFDSYAPSWINKSQTKVAAAQSNSDYSESYASYSQSFRNIR